MLLSLGATGCSSVRSALALNNDQNSASSAPIHNPFGEVNAQNADRSQNMILRTKKGDRAVEIELPSDSQQLTDFTIPVAPAFQDSKGAGSRSPASDSSDGSDYQKHPTTMADREITRSFPQGPADQEGERRQIEQGLGLMPSEDSVPAADESYLGALDHVKQLYRTGRYEAGLVEIDGLIRQYPTAPRVHQMRGTLLDRLGQSDLAIKSWKQALRLDPKNDSLRKFIERREQKRSLASP